MNHKNLVHNILHLVALQVSDHMPADVLRHNLILIHELLHLVFPKIAAAARIRLFQHGNRLRLAHRDQLHPACLPAARRAGIFDIFSDDVKIFFYVHIRSCLQQYHHCETLL